MSADCEGTQISPERDQRHVRDKNVDPLPLLSCKYVNSHLQQYFNISVTVQNERSTAHLSYERSVRKWRSNFCAQVELLIINYICKDTNKQYSYINIYRMKRKETFPIVIQFIRKMK